jgi:hypothetical protein
VEKRKNQRNYHQQQKADEIDFRLANHLLELLVKLMDLGLESARLLIVLGFGLLQINKQAFLFLAIVSIEVRLCEQRVMQFSVLLGRVEIELRHFNKARTLSSSRSNSATRVSSSIILVRASVSLSFKKQ